MGLFPLPKLNCHVALEEETAFFHAEHNGDGRGVGIHAHTDLERVYRFIEAAIIEAETNLGVGARLDLYLAPTLAESSAAVDRWAEKQRAVFRSVFDVFVLAGQRICSCNIVRTQQSDGDTCVVKGGNGYAILVTLLSEDILL